MGVLSQSGGDRITSRRSSNTRQTIRVIPYTRNPYPQPSPRHHCPCYGLHRSSVSPSRRACDLEALLAIPPPRREGFALPGAQKGHHGRATALSTVKDTRGSEEP